MKSKPWTDAHAREAVARTYEIVGEMVRAGRLNVAGLGLVELDQVLSPYNATMADVRDKNLWGRRLVARLAAALSSRRASSVQIIVLAGAAYAQPIERAARRRQGWFVEEPTAGMQIGERLSFLSRAEPSPT